jgi:hypothetical protein
VRHGDFAAATGMVSRVALPRMPMKADRPVGVTSHTVFVDVGERTRRDGRRGPLRDNAQSQSVCRRSAATDQSPQTFLTTSGVISLTSPRLHVRGLRRSDRRSHCQKPR